jgi:hypothetical protein
LEIAEAREPKATNFSATKDDGTGGGAAESDFREERIDGILFNLIEALGGQRPTS